MNDLADRQYQGQGNDRNYQPLELPNKIVEDIPRKKEPYIADQKLAEAVNDALYLRRPLLLEGEPGCGKTRLAYSVAYELGYPLKECYIRSTSRAEELLYTYDNIQRLYDLQENKSISTQQPERDTIKEPKANDSSESPNTIDRRKYVELGKLGEAIKLSAEQDIPSVVLIDEIDKADIDFPNDLLLVLDRLQFEIKEVKGLRYDALKGESQEDRKDVLPLIIITSNREKELPKAFLRRCLFYYIEFPNKNDLRRIIINHFQEEISPLFEVALNKFLELREAISWRKKPSTGEFINWLRLLKRGQKNEKTKSYEEITEETLTATPLHQLPFLHTLVKNESDQNALGKIQANLK
ncbi:MAG: MoxR family ATPase [Gomphosphaeria aponina SAG 52.96 = DSM 107014]|uniref:MoxR family ATPase n=1 Tax=Gomphosphaeria aponina SAG 52.96 = DSM 107014 TaxID=1521640 RepID=A0A941GXM0_9CHRO|nr:MoxR family ATPase [Gomphosphaeria aponina SAG 52.96 = DSM 107014]